MESLIVEIEVPEASRLVVTEAALTAHLADGRVVSAPLTWYPRLVHATQEERDNWEIFGDGRFFHWPDLDEDLSLESMLAGWPSQESQSGFKRWLAAKKAGLPVNIYEIQPVASEEA